MIFPGGMQLAAIAVGGSAILGAMGGFWVCSHYFSHAYLKDQVAHLEKKLHQYETMLGVARDLDDQANQDEMTNQEIQDAIIQRARELKGPDDPVCLDPDFMRELKKLR